VYTARVSRPRVRGRRIWQEVLAIIQGGLQGFDLKIMTRPEIDATARQSMFERISSEG